MQLIVNWNRPNSLIRNRWKKKPFSAKVTLPITIHTQISLGFKPGLCILKPVTNQLSYYTAYFILSQYTWFL